MLLAARMVSLGAPPGARGADHRDNSTQWFHRSCRSGRPAPAPVLPMPRRGKLPTRLCAPRCQPCGSLAVQQEHLAELACLARRASLLEELQHFKQRAQQGGSVLEAQWLLCRLTTVRNWHLQASTRPFENRLPMLGLLEGSVYQRPQPRTRPLAGLTRQMGDTTRQSGDLMRHLRMIGDALCSKYLVCSVRRSWAWNFLSDVFSAHTPF